MLINKKNALKQGSKEGGWLDPEEAQMRISPQAWALISNTGSLTQCLRQLTDNKIQFSLLTQGWGSVHPLDYYALNLLGLFGMERTWIRHIEWRYQNNLWVYAVTLIPESTVKQIGADPAQWTQPLGETLFQDPFLNRSPLRFRQLVNNPLYAGAPPELLDPNVFPLWTRQSLLSFKHHPLLVRESFLPAAYGKYSY